MFVVAIVSQKGGSGKTTLTGHLSVQAGLSGMGPVAIVDTDPQGSLAAWWNERENELPFYVQSDLHDLPARLEDLRKAGVKLVMIDTPPAITSAIHQVIAVADYIVVPTKPSPHDLRAVGATVKLVQSCNKPMVFVLNDASPRAKITYEAAIALSQHGTVAPVTIHHRTLFASSMIDGRTAQELETKGQSALEILGLWEYINARLNLEILPTSIGLNASRRYDGVSNTKAAVNLSDSALQQLQPQETKPEITPEPDIPQPALPESTLVASMLKTDVPPPAAETELWAGFASEDVAAPKAGENPDTDQTTVDERVVHRPKVFGRRQGA